MNPTIDRNEKILALELKANTGDAEAQFQLGRLYDNPDNSSTSEDCKKALAWYEKAAAQGFPKAAEYSAYLLLHGLAGEIDHERAMRWLMPIANRGDAWARELIADSYHRGQGTSPNLAEALKWYEMAAEAGSGQGMFRLGYAAANGQSAPQDFGKAIEWFKNGAEKEISSCRACLGYMHWKGAGVPQNFDEATKWFNLAMETRGGNTWAPFMLGIMAENGQGMPRDTEKAIAYYQSSAAQRYYHAKIRCGLLHQAGFEVPDYDEDLKWLTQGDSTAHPVGQYLLGLSYKQGKGVPRDDRQALQWFILAADELPSAASERNELAARLSMSEQQSAEEQALAIREGFRGKTITLF